MMVELKFWQFQAAAGLLALVVLGDQAHASADFQGASHLVPLDEDGMHYSKSKDSNAVTRLQLQIDSGKVKPVRDPKAGYLPWLLEALHVPKSSQSLVFSKTSFQRERISPKTPRALFFNDDVYLGFIPGSPLMELSVADPQLGGVFYTLDQAKFPPRFVRTDQCLECHASAKNLGVPGHLARSFMTDEAGVVDLASGISPVTHCTPIEERWGGWYVTGNSGEQIHRGNLIGPAAFERQKREPDYLRNLDRLDQFFTVAAYPETGSDIVALMTLEHQTHFQNFITRLNYEASQSLAQYGHIDYVKRVAESFLRYLLFSGEASFKNAMVGSSTFTKDFQQRGPFDSKGRSLRECDLRTRLFKYPCSYLIYSEQFDALPGPAKEYVYRRLFEILTDHDQSGDYDHLTRHLRQAILEILRDTKKDLPAYWRPGETEKNG